MKKLIMLLVLGILLFANPVEVSARVSFTQKVDFEVAVSADQVVHINQTVVIENKSENNLISEINVTIPLKFQNLKTTYSGKKISATVKSNKVNIDFGDNYIKPQSKKTITLEYELLDLVSQFGRIYTIQLPKLNDQSREYRLKFSYPEEWGELSFSSIKNIQVEKENEVYNVEADVNSEAIFMVGDYTAASMSLAWNIHNTSGNAKTYRIPLPSGPSTIFTYEEWRNITKGYKDDMGNEYLLLELKPQQILAGDISGLISFERKDFHEQKGNKSFLKGYSNLDVAKFESVEGIYNKVLEILQPEQTGQLRKRRTVEELVNNENQSSVDYANALVSALRSNGFSSELVYGPAKLPFSDKFIWHYWVLYKENDSSPWMQVDPYMEDLTGYDFFDSITPERIIWGVLSDDMDVSTLGLEYYPDINSNVTFLEESPVLGLDSVFEVTVDITDKVFSGKLIPVQLIIHNKSNRSLTLEEIKLENITLDWEDLKNTSIVPDGIGIVKVPGVSVKNPLIKGAKDIEGSIIVNIGGDKQTKTLSKIVEFEVDQTLLTLNTVMVFAFTTALYVFIRYHYHNKKNI